MKQERYLDKNGDDWIDECARTLTKEEFRGAMKFTVGKYMRRMGKKDPIEQERAKVNDYIERWIGVEFSYAEEESERYPDILTYPVAFAGGIRLRVYKMVDELDNGK